MLRVKIQRLDWIDYGSEGWSSSPSGRATVFAFIPELFYDDPMAESEFALLKTELIRKQRPWRSVEQVELATLEWVWWFKNHRLSRLALHFGPAIITVEESAETHMDRVASCERHSLQ
jgi:hypothetical protein